MTQIRKPISLEQALSDLGPEQASEDFTRRVLARLDEPRSPRIARTRAGWVASLAVVAAIALVLGIWLHPHSASEETAQVPRNRQLRQELESLHDEVAVLRTLAAQPPPVLYLGGDSRIDLVLDLRQGDLGATPSRGRAVTAGTRRVESAVDRPK